MPDLASLTDYDPVVDQPIVADPARRIPVYKDDDPPVEQPSKTSVAINNVLNKLFRDDDQRYQLWPEKVVREAITGTHDVGTSESPRWAIDPNTGDVHTSPQMIEKAQAISALAGTGGLGGVTDATLGATPFLRPALKYKDKLYKGKEGQQHMDVIPEHLYPEFQDMAMKGEDISHYNFGFYNDKGQFLNREKALEYGINTGLIDPQAGKFGALTSTLMADSTKPGMAIEAMGKANPFFSAVEHNVNAIPQTKMNGEAWLGTLSNKPGVKPEELDWTGLKSFLEENKGKVVTKEQIQSHLEQNKVELKEVEKGGEAGTKEKAFELAKEHGWKTWDDIDPATQAKYMQRASKEAGENPTKYHSYQLPGGENYREMLLTLPAKQFDNSGLKAARDALKRHEDSYDAKRDYYNPDNQPPTEWALKARELRKNLKEAEKGTAAEPKASGAAGRRDEYKSSHWDEPNILAHVRMNDRDVGGKKSLHLEEIQSDWHQQGRDKGYASSGSLPKFHELNKQFEEARTDLGFATEKKATELLGMSFQKYRQMYPAEKDSALQKLKDYRNKDPEYVALEKKVADLDKARMEANPVGKIPDAPFKKSWHELALKRMIREAAEKGYDRLSWTPGEAQAARYDLSKQVKRVFYDPDLQGGTLAAEGMRPGSTVLDKQGIKPEQIADYIGKDAAKKLLETKRNDVGHHVLEGDGLKVGGEGMKGFYDQIIPKALEKIGKEHGVKMKQGNLSNERMSVQPGYKEKSWDVVSQSGTGIKKFDTKAEAEAYVNERGAKIHYIDIPKSLRDAAMHKGFPLFSSTHMFIPVDHDPFEKKK